MANYRKPAPSGRRRGAPTKRALMGVVRGPRRRMRRRSRSGKVRPS